MHVGSLFFLLVWKCLCVSVSRGGPSIYFLLNIGYVVYVWGRMSTGEVCYQGCGMSTGEVCQQSPVDITSVSSTLFFNHKATKANTRKARRMILVMNVMMILVM